MVVVRSGGAPGWAQLWWRKAGSGGCRSGPGRAVDGAGTACVEAASDERQQGAWDERRGAQHVAQDLRLPFPAAIEKLRDTAMLRIGELDGGADAVDRARRLRQVAQGGELRRALTLLVVAEDSYYRWQRVRLEHARTADPDHVSDMAERATAQLAADLRADQQLIELLDAKLADYAIQKPLERLHPIATRQLADDAQSLHSELAAFAHARRAQVQGWEAPAKPTWGDTAGELRSRAAAPRSWPQPQVSQPDGPSAPQRRTSLAGGPGATLDRVADGPARCGPAASAVPVVLAAAQAGTGRHLPRRNCSDCAAPIIIVVS